MARLQGNIDYFRFEIIGQSHAFKVSSFEGEEGLSRLFQYTLELVTEDGDLDLSTLVGQAARLSIHGADESIERVVHGTISRMDHGDTGRRYTTYYVDLVPRVLWLTQRSNCRIFQNLTAIDIVKQVLAQNNIAADTYKVACNGTHEPREYCVQYRETELEFIERLLAEEGIYYYFEHSEENHKLIFADHTSAHKAISGETTVNYHPGTGTVADQDSVRQFSYGERVRPGAVTLRDYAFQKPSLNLEAQEKYATDKELELYDYGARYDLPKLGMARAKMRLEAQQVARKFAKGQSDCMRLIPGATFTLAEHSHGAFNQSYLITYLHSEGRQPQVLEEGASDQGSRYANRFSAIPASVQYRAGVVTEKPVMRGMQTAVVVGPSGEEIYTDEFGRVKVQFHWDRDGKNDDKSSCWMRVSQLWAGAGWGAMFIPRIGQEVLVDFIEGDPDRPVVVGRMYHGVNRPPYPLPANKTRSTIMSQSTPGGGGSNELRFEDKNGSEEVYLHAQKDLNVVVEHDASARVGHNERNTVGVNKSESIGSNKSESVGANKTISVGANHTETIGAGMTLTVGKNKTETVAINCAETIGVAKELTIGGAYQVTVGAAMNETVGGAKAEEVGGARALAVGGACSETIGGNRTVKVGGELKEIVDNKHEFSAKEIKITAADKFTVECGAASITLEKSGKVTVKGTEINIEGTGMSKFETGAILTLKGAQTRVNC